MKVIDLLNLMVIGEDLPKRIRYEDEEYYLTNDEETYIGCISHSAIGRRHCLEQCLTDEVEIIEEDEEIEHYDLFDNFTGYGFGGTDKGLLTHLQRNFVNINQELDYLMKLAKELKKGK